MPLFLEKIEEKDREFAQKIKSLLEFVNRDDTLSAKTRILISLAIDAVQGKEEGVISITARAREMGVSDDEIAAVLRLVFLGSGFPGLATGTKVFE
jgi:alkylhydroperoxidase/carboxymuconolactone decarboxylase family protein YurZ